MEIKRRYTDEIIFSDDTETMVETLCNAIKQGANLSFASLRWANLIGANLRGVNLSGAYLSGANLRGVDLSGADLRGVNLSGANLRGVNLSGADLSETSLRGCIGNSREIKTLFISNLYPITYTSEYLQIGCERHAINKWWEFDNSRVNEMDGKTALEFWDKHKELIKLTIETCPAKESKQHD